MQVIHSCDDLDKVRSAMFCIGGLKAPGATKNKVSKSVGNSKREEIYSENTGVIDKLILI